MEKKMSNPWAGSGNYTADDDTYPREVRFANGRIVRLNTGADEHAYLIVEQVDYMMPDLTTPPDARDTSAGISGEVDEYYWDEKDCTYVVEQANKFAEANGLEFHISNRRTSAWFLKDGKMFDSGFYTPRELQFFLNGWDHGNNHPATTSEAIRALLKLHDARSKEINYIEKLGDLRACNGYPDELEMIKGKSGAFVINNFHELQAFYEFAPYIGQLLQALQSLAPRQTVGEDKS